MLLNKENESRRRCRGKTSHFEGASLELVWDDQCYNVEVV